MKNLLLLITVLISFFSNGQTKEILEEFKEQLKEDSLKLSFEKKLLQLDNSVKKGILSAEIDSLVEKPEYNFLDRKTINGQTALVLDLSAVFKDAYTHLEQGGRIKNLTLLRKKGLLKIVARGIANEVMEVEYPRNLRNIQSINNFYLKVIREFLQKNKQIVDVDKLSFITYQALEKEANLKTPVLIGDFRKSFIRFLYKKYRLN